MLRNKFESSEHDALIQIILPGLDVEHQLMPMPNGISLGFSDIIALAGDYYAIPERPISRGVSPQDCRDRFLEAYQRLAYAKRAEIRDIFDIITKQRRLIKAAMERGESEYSAVKRFSFEEIIRANCITRGHFTKISVTNFDHFGENAKKAHHVGHLAAIDAAIEAYRMTDPKERNRQLAYAYTLEAFSQHYLSDLFATGHIRTPRYELRSEFGESVGALLALFMHNEENFIGLNVKNKKNLHWKAFGDGHLFEAYNATTREVTIRALKAAIMEVHDAYNTGTNPLEEKCKDIFGNERIKYKESAAYAFLPEIDENAANPSPLFKNDCLSGQLFVRKNLNDIYCKDYEVLTKCKVACVLTHFLSLIVKDAIFPQKSGFIAHVNHAMASLKPSTHSCFNIFKHKNKSSTIQSLELNKPRPALK